MKRISAALLVASTLGVAGGGVASARVVDLRANPDSAASSTADPSDDAEAQPEGEDTDGTPSNAGEADPEGTTEGEAGKSAEGIQADTVPTALDLMNRIAADPTQLANPETISQIAGVVKAVAETTQSVSDSYGSGSSTFKAGDVEASDAAKDSLNDADGTEGSGKVSDNPDDWEALKSELSKDPNDIDVDRLNKVLATATGKQVETETPASDKESTANEETSTPTSAKETTSEREADTTTEAGESEAPRSEDADEPTEEAAATEERQEDEPEAGEANQSDLNRVVVIGDATTGQLTADLQTADLQSALKEKSGYDTVDIDGAVGSQIEGGKHYDATARIEEQKAGDKADWYIAMGINDAAALSTSDDVEAAAKDRINKVMTLLKDQGKVYWPTIDIGPRVSDANGDLDQAKIQAAVDAFNKALKQVAEDNDQLTVVDWDPEDSAYSDSIHFSPEGAADRVESIVSTVSKND